MDTDIRKVFGLFFDAVPTTVQTIDTSDGDDDFRAAVLVETEAGSKYVLKLADNDFTFPERIAVWKRTAEEYRKLGYYCPRIFADKSGGFPSAEFCGHNCTVYAEEFAPYRSAGERVDAGGCKDAPYDGYQRDVWRMTARIAAQHLDYTKYPSAYCLFETFCPSDQTDEVLDNALKWKAYANTLPDAFKEQTERIWRRWTENRAALEPIYQTLPTSVFQADLNPTNILLDDAGRFVGVYDFNLCGRDVFLNYLMRENYGDFHKERIRIFNALKFASEDYRFSALEKKVAPMLYRCLKPLSFISTETLKEAGNDGRAIAAVLDETERCLTDEFDFGAYME